MSDNVNLTLGDLHQVVSVIDLAISRGVFKGTELVFVGTIYTKLIQFIQLASSQSEAQIDNREVI